MYENPYTSHDFIRLVMTLAPRLIPQQVCTKALSYIHKARHRLLLQGRQKDGARTTDVSTPPAFNQLSHWERRRAISRDYSCFTIDLPKFVDGP